MKSRLILVTTGLIAALLGLPAFAQNAPATTTEAAPTSGPGMMQGAPGGRMMHRQRDCSKAPDPTACTAMREAHQKAREACKDAPAGQRRNCMQEQRQNVDCSKTANPQQCEARKTAAKACEGQSGRDFHQCMQQKMPPVDCSKANNPQRCEQHQKAREAFKDKTGPDHKTCLREQFKVK
ncbi:MAG: hypothetical protein D3M94_16245 [Rhodocyclales bacterium GT-UBC]|nr:MAG: hypothetical protein D3M94_16245 [Rhodocyclales bacterium GT-UBC]